MTENPSTEVNYIIEDIPNLLHLKKKKITLQLKI